MKDIKKSVAAGSIIGLGVIINVLVSPPVLGALLFSFGLLTIIILLLPVNKGKIGFYGTSELNWKISPYITVLIGNLIGVILCVFLYAAANSSIIPLLRAAAAIKFTKTFLQMFIYGLFCGVLIHLAVKIRQPLITCMAIVIFILIGAEHCIATFPFLILNFNFINLIKYLCIILGNSLGAIIINKIIT